MQREGPFFYYRLENGLRVVVEPMPDVRSAAVGFLVRAGARDEPAELAGASHFLEHMCFKGTARRNWRQITVGFDELGSYYNAFTTKDRTFYFGWVRGGDIIKQIELLADVMRPALPGEEFQTEKQVILEEIAMSRDRLEHRIYDLIHEKVFGDHPLARPVIGYEQTIESLRPEQLQGYLQQHYAPQRMVLIVAGRVEPEEIREAAERFCGSWCGSSEQPGRRPPARLPVGTAVQQIDRFKQQGVALVFGSCSAVDEEHEVAQATAAILGGENSRFFWNIVQAGIAPRAGAWSLEYEDCGSMVLFGLCQPEAAERLVEAMQREAVRISSQPVTEQELERVKNRRRTALAAEAESPRYRLGQILDDVDYRGQARTVEQRLKAVDAVTADRVAEYLQRWPIGDQGYLVSVGPRDWPPT
ncbi:MAG: M16 family metallopeptidase [Phycisphaerae bacterium]